VTAEQIAGVLLIAGSTVFGLGAVIGVPRVFTVQDAEIRLRMLELHRGLWRVAQPLYGAGAVVAALAVGYLASGAADGRSRTALWGACVALLTGGLAWGWSLYLRGTRIAAFAFRTLPGWPFAAYVVLTTGGLMPLGVGLLLGGFPTWLGWLTCQRRLLDHLRLVAGHPAVRLLRRAHGRWHHDALTISSRLS